MCSALHCADVRAGPRLAPATCGLGPGRWGGAERSALLLVRTHSPAPACQLLPALCPPAAVWRPRHAAAIQQGVRLFDLGRPGELSGSCACTLLGSCACARLPCMVLHLSVASCRVLARRWLLEPCAAALTPARPPLVALRCACRCGRASWCRWFATFPRCSGWPTPRRRATLRCCRRPSSRLVRAPVGWLTDGLVAGLMDRLID